MRTVTQVRLSVVAACALSILGGMATAQDADIQTQVEDVQQRYEQAIAAGDWEALASLYTENPIYSPLSGGIIEDRQEIQNFYGQSGLKALDLRSTRAETVGENLILDIGTFTATLPGEAGEDMVVEGEYVALSEVGENGVLLRSVTAFPRRQAPDAPVQQ